MVSVQILVSTWKWNVIGLLVQEGGLMVRLNFCSLCYNASLKFLPLLRIWKAWLGHSHINSEIIRLKNNSWSLVWCVLFWFWWVFFSFALSDFIVHLSHILNLFSEIWFGLNLQWVCWKKKAEIPMKAADPSSWDFAKNPGIYCENQNEIIYIACTGINKRLPALEQAIEIPMVA